MTIASEKEVPTEREYAWRLVKWEGESSATLELGSAMADLSDAELTFVTRRIGEVLIKAGTMFIQSRIGDDDEEDY